jgi:hypothetical protein
MYTVTACQNPLYLLCCYIWCLQVYSYMLQYIYHENLCYNLWLNFSGSLTAYSMQATYLGKLQKGPAKVSVCVRVIRKWTVRQTIGQRVPLYIGLVLADARVRFMHTLPHLYMTIQR